jgi:hypothetical protein
MGRLDRDLLPFLSPDYFPFYVRDIEAAYVELVLATLCMLPFVFFSGRELMSDANGNTYTTQRE